MTRKRRRHARWTPTYSTLEPRRVLAGNVFAFVNDGVLSIFGDADANQIEVTGDAGGGIQVTGIDTTINGVNTPFSTGGIGFVTIGLGNGDDEATVSNLNLTGNLSIFGESGNDRLIVSGSSSRFLHLRGGGENDVVELEHSVRKSAYVYLDEGDDVFSVVNQFAGRNFKVFGGDGNDTFASRSMQVGRKFELHLENGDDQALISGRSQVRKIARIYTGNGNDFVSIAADDNAISVHFDRVLRVNLGEGDDNLVVGTNASFDARPNFDGEQGTDSIQLGEEDEDATQRRFENESLGNLQALIDVVIASLDAAGVDNTQPIVDLSVATSAEALTFTENGAATVADPSVTLRGTEIVQSATVSISNFSEGDEALAFTDTDTITGSFDETTGNLELTGNASVQTYQAALRTVTYQNTSEDPVETARQIQFTVVADEESVSASRELVITPENDTPDISLQAGDQTIESTDFPLLIDNSLTITDVDNTGLVSATVEISSGLESNEDALGFTAVDSISGNYDSATGILTLTPTEGDSAALADFQTVLRSIQFETSAAEPSTGTRVIRFTVNDGAATDFDELSITVANSPANGS